MKILFVYPAISESGFNSSGNELLYSHIHAGLSVLSAVCKKNDFNNISLIDLRTLKSWEDFKEKIKGIKPDVVGITMMSVDYEYASRCIDIIKDIDKETITVVGGMHPTVMTEEVRMNKKIDYIITGEGEIAFPELLKKIEKKEKSDRIIKGTRPDLNKLPFIDRELFNFLELPFDFFLPFPFATILAGRGCNYACKFCSPAGKIMHGSSIRRRSVNNVIEEIRHLIKTYGIKSIQFWDDCFTEDINWVKEFCKKYEEENIKLPFIIQTRSDIICKNFNMMKMLRKAGLVMAAIGFESGNDRVLKFMNKGVTTKDNLKAANICKRLGIKIWAYNLMGVPTERIDEARDTLRMIRKIKPYRSSTAFFSPHPGSSFYEYCKKNDLSLITAHNSFERSPETDYPKIKGIDYDRLRILAKESKELSLGVKIRMRFERIVAHKKNKIFKLKFKEETRNNEEQNKMAVLRIAHQAGRI